MNTDTAPPRKRVELIGTKVTIVNIEGEKKRESFKDFELLVNHLNRGPRVDLENWKAIPSPYLKQINQDKIGLIDVEGDHNMI